MNEKRKNVIARGSRKLFVRTYSSIAAVTIIFAVVLGFFYIRLFDRKTVENYKDDLMLRASAVAQKCSECFNNYRENSDTDYIDRWRWYIAALNAEGIEVVPVRNENAKYPLELTFAVSETTYTLSEAQKAIFNRAMDSQDPVTSEYYNSEQEKNFIIAAERVAGVNGEWSGVVIISKPTSDQATELVNSSFTMILISSVVALVVSFVLAIPFVKALTHPISSIRSTALTLARGDYSAKTGITRTDEVGELARAMDFLSDKLEENEIERKNAEQMRLDFFANVSHELRTPITVVRAYTETLADGVVTDPEKIKAIYARMNDESLAMERLVGDLLTLSKMQNPNFSIEKEPVNLQQVFSDLLRTASAMAEEKGIEIRCDMGDNPCIMQGDYGRLRQMFLVILDNAIKFSNEGGTVCMTLRVDTKITATIRDEGIGMSEEEIPYIFEKFYRSKLRQNAKGSGLGLAIAKYICLKHDGEISIESEKGKGTCFTFTFEPETKVRRK